MDSDMGHTARRDTRRLTVLSSFRVNKPPLVGSLE